jgi:hypothetical protein
VRPPRNIPEALGNLFMLLAATVGEDDVKLFRFHVKVDKKWLGRIYEMNVAPVINFKWSYGNLDCGRKADYDAASEVLKDLRMSVLGQKRTNCPGPKAGVAFRAAAGKVATFRVSRAEQPSGGRNLAARSC